MRKTFISPSKFVLGEDEFKRLNEHVAELGSKAVIIAHPDDYARVKDAIEESMAGKDFLYVPFCGECCEAEIRKIKELVLSEGADVIVGLGGGKALDTAKAVSMYTNSAVIIAPTIAATDAPTSALSLVYTETGEFEKYLHLRRNPDMVLVDTAVIAKAPVRFLVSGMGDALATVFEARACSKAFEKNMSGGQSTKAALAIAETCYATLMEDSLKAKAACEVGVVTQALENIVEANILLSGLGFESSGLAAAHAIHDGLTMLEEAHHFYHGEKVAFGTLVQLVLENASQETLNEVLTYCKAVGLPVCLKDLGVEHLDHERLMRVAEMSCSEEDTMANMPFPVTPKDVAAAILTADHIGGAFKV